MCTFSHSRDMRTGQTCNPQAFQNIQKSLDLNFTYILKKLTPPLDLFITKTSRSYWNFSQSGLAEPEFDMIRSF